ncbi:MAG: hypothetical protein H8D92_00215 [Pelagibacteraceae bacterium]|nr:hypothetical protein [Pelagibacteraceae bacterium]
MKNLQSFNEFINESEVVNENINKMIPEFIEKIKDAESGFPEKNKRSQLLRMAKKAGNQAETIDQDTKFTYSPDGQIFVVYKYKDQNAVDAWLWKGEGSEKSKEDLVRSVVYAETGRPGYRVMADGSKSKIGKYGETKY